MDDAGAVNAGEMFFRQSFFPFAQRFFDQKLLSFDGKNVRITARRRDVRNRIDFQKYRPRAGLHEKAVVEFEWVRGVCFFRFRSFFFLRHLNIKKNQVQIFRGDYLDGLLGVFGFADDLNFVKASEEKIAIPCKLAARRQQSSFSKFSALPTKFAQMIFLNLGL